MSEKNEAVQKKSRFQGMKAEFKKVIWPSREEITKSTIAVVVVSIVLGLVIAGLDALINFGMSFLT